MRTSILCVAIFALAACNGAETDADDANANGEVADTASASDVLEGERPGFEAVAPGTYQVTRAGGEVDYIEIHPGMTFSRVAADGSATGGSIFMKDGKTCFDAEGDDTAVVCYTIAETGADGTFVATPDDGGDPLTIRKTA